MKNKGYASQIAAGLVIGGIIAEISAGFLGLPSYAADKNNPKKKQTPIASATKQKITYQQQTIIDELNKQLIANGIDENSYKIEANYRLSDSQIADAALVVNGEPIRAYDINGIGHHINNSTGRYTFRLVDNINSVVPIGFSPKPKNFKGSDYEWYVSEGIGKDIPGEDFSQLTKGNTKPRIVIVKDIYDLRTWRTEIGYILR